MKRDASLLLSLSDYFYALLRMRWVVAAVALFSSLVIGFYLLLRPPTFTAHAVFKGGTSSSSSSSSSALLRAMPGFVSNLVPTPLEDPRLFFKAYPVLESVVRTLHLQMDIQEVGKQDGFGKRLWHTLQAERASRLLKKKGIGVATLSGRAPPSLFLEERAPPPLACTEVEYAAEVGARLELFPKEGGFLLKKGKQIVGEGTWGVPFQWEGGSFTFAPPSTPLTSSFLLTFIPMEVATRGIEGMVTCKRDKQSVSIMHLSCTHTDRHFASRLANAMMRSYQAYTREEGKRQIAQELQVLQESRQAHFGELDQILSESEARCVTRLNEEGGQPFAKSRLEEAVVERTKKEAKVKEIVGELLLLYRTEPGHARATAAEALEEVRLRCESPPLPLTSESARRLLEESIVALDKMVVTEGHTAQGLEALDQPDYDPEALSILCTEKTMQAHLATIHTLRQRLMDVRSWSEKERLVFQQELEKEKRLLRKALYDSQTGLACAKRELEKHIQALKETLFFHLLRRHDALTKELEKPMAKAQEIAAQVREERALELQTTLLTNTIASLTSAIESHAVECSARASLGTPLLWAFPPVLPNSPHLRLGMIAGALLGAFVLAAWVVGREILLGPTASVPNLLSLGKEARPFSQREEEIRAVAHHLYTKGNCLALVSTNRDFPLQIAAYFGYAQERVLLLEVVEGKASTEWVALLQTLKGQETSFGERILLPLPKEGREMILASPSFHAFLAQQRARMDRVLLHCSAMAEEVLLPLLSRVADTTVWMVEGKRVSELPELPSCLYLVDYSSSKPLSIKELLPHLLRVMSFPLRSVRLGIDA